MKTKRVSLAVKVYLMILVIFVVIFSLVLLNSRQAYRNSVFTPYEKRLETAVVPEESVRPFLESFLPFLGSEELQKARENTNDSNDGVLEWLTSSLSDPSGTPPEEDGPGLFSELISFSISVDQFRERLDADNVCVDLVKDGTAYRVYDSAKAGDLSRFTLDLAMEVSDSLPASDFASPVVRSAERGVEILRCAVLALDGGEGRFWIRYDMNDEQASSDRFLFMNLIAILILMAAASAVSLYLLRRFLVRPVRSLAQAAKEFRPEEDGTYSMDKVSRIDLRSEDELGDLSREIRTMQEQIVENTGNLSRLTAEKERVRTELDLARRIQASALPKEVPDRAEITMSASMKPALDVGGDFYDYFMIDENRLALVIADVSGKGIPAALFMMASKSVIRSAAMRSDGPAEMLKTANELIAANNEDNMFVTVWMGVLDLRTGILAAASAGHEYPAVARGGKYELLKDKHGLAVGLMTGVSYKTYELRLEPGDRIFVYTDGVAEAHDPENQMFGTDRMISVLNENPEASPEKTLSDVLDAVNAFARDAKQFDDITMLCLQYNRPAV